MPRSNIINDTICVLSIVWDNNDLGVEPLAQELLQVFKDVYGAEPTFYKIQSNVANPPWQFIKFTEKWVMENAEDSTLLVFAYSGHAEASQSGFDTSWMGKDPSANPGVPQVSWNSLRDKVNASPSDALFVLDCCNASSASLQSYKLKPKGNQFLCACSLESIASGNLAQSFTRRFIDLLKRYRRTAMSVNGLHSIMWSEAGDPATYLEYTPNVFGCGGDGNSIVLRPGVNDPADVQELKQRKAACAGKVVVTVSLKGRSALPDEPGFKQWILSKLPPDVSDIKVEAIFDAESTVILATIPYSAWDILQFDDKITFVAVVKSNNLLLNDAWKEDRALAVRPRPGRDENQPFGESSRKPLR